MRSKRIYKFDNLKFLLIMFVVIGHFIDLYISERLVMKKIFIFIYSFHMPLFIFLTGLFQKKINSFKEIPMKKIFFYIFLIYFMKITIFLVSKHYNLGYTFSLLSGEEVYWYLGVAIIYLLITPFIDKIKFSYLFIFSIIIGIFVGYDNTINDYLYLSRAIVFFPFYLLGYHYINNKDFLLEICNKKILKFISIIIIILFACICIFRLDDIYKYRMLFTGRNPYSYFTKFVCTYKHRLFTYIVSFLLGFSFLCIAPNKKIKIISNMGKRTLQVYVLHQPIIIFMKGIGLFDILKDNFGNYFIYIYLLIAVILTFFLSLRLFDRVFKYIKNNMFIE